MIEKTQTEKSGHKIKINGYSHRKLDLRLNQRQTESIQRQVKYDSLSLEDKIKLVTERGGSIRELNRLQKKLLELSSSDASQPPITETKKNKYKKGKK